MFCFGSEIKALLKHPQITAELNLHELPNYLNWGMSSRSTLFNGIEKLSPGHFLKYSKKDGLAIKRYWSPIKQNLEYTGLSENDICEHILSLLRQSIDARMMSDVPFGVFLSGGIDSSLNVALMYELMTRPIDTYTVGFKELEKYNELEYARKISKIYKTNHHEILIDHNDAFPILQELTWHEDEPNADPVCIPLYFLSKLTRDSGTIVIQVGEGSDEQFCGYRWMLREYNFEKSYWKAFNKAPKFAKLAIHNISKPIFNNLNFPELSEYFRRASNNEQLYWGGNPIFSPSFLHHLISEEYSNLNNIPSTFASTLHSEALSLKPDADYLQRIAYVELSNRLSEILLMRVDKIGMAHSIEARVPFLDHRLVEFSMSIPPNLKAPNKHTTKHILKKAVKGILPEEIINRRKQGFWAPVNEWLRNEWKDYAYSTIMNNELFKSGIFNKKYVNKLFYLHSNGKRNFGLQLFSLLTLALWHEKFFGKNK